jgi:cysteine desulfurase/selenocysteine lyase
VPIDVQKLGVDFLAFSSHKLFGPTGVGILYGRRALLEKMPPVFGGGDMIRSVTFEKTTYADLPARLEAGTPGIASMIGLGAAIDYVQSVGLSHIYAQEQKLLAYGTERLGAIEELQIVGTAKKKTSIISFTLGDIHPHDIGSLLDQEGVAIRAGHHCTQPLMKRMGVVATARASMAFYNTTAEIDVLAEAIQKVVRLFA